MNRPDTNPKSIVGVRKPSMHAVPATAMVHLGRAMADGERKYGLMNWRQHPVAATVYYDAALRHLMAWFDGREANAPDSDVPHLAHVMACCAILLDAGEQGNMVDDRPENPGRVVEVLRELTSNFVEKAKIEDALVDAVQAALEAHTDAPGVKPNPSWHGIALRPLGDEILEDGRRV